MKNKDKILNIVEKSHCGITATEIFDKLLNEINKTTVYRNLEKLSLEGKINEEFDSN
jgi:Fe2+ or Zn2+ uptake regulation protein